MVPDEEMPAAETTMPADYHDLFDHVDFVPGIAICPLTSYISKKFINIHYVEYLTFMYI